MIEEHLKNCAIAVFDEKDKKFCEKYKTYPVFIVENPDVNNVNINTLLVGWENVHKLFPKQKITERKISDKLYWTFSKKEEKHFSENEIEMFIHRNVNNFFNINIVSYDALKEGDFRKFIRAHLNKDNLHYVYFFKKCMYIFSPKMEDVEPKILCINVESIEYVFGNSKNIITELLSKLKFTAFSYKNMNGYVDFDLMKKKLLTVENIYWTKYNKELLEEDIKKLFPKRDINRFFPYLSMLITNVNLGLEEFKSCERLAERDIITIWLSSASIFFDKTYKPSDDVKIKWYNYRKYTKSEYSDKKTITGRINCIGNFNPQMLPRTSEVRKNIVSRFNKGKIVTFDYVSFETKLSLYYSNNDENKWFVEKYKNSDLHLELAKIIFQSDKITKEQRELGKIINHVILYGGGDKLILEKLEVVNDKKEALARIKEFLKPILDTAKIVNSEFDEFGYIVNNFGTIIRPNKNYAAYNNFIQSTASEIVVDKLYEIKNWLKNCKSKFMFQTHDSFTFDFEPSELHKVKELENLLNKYKGFNFQVEYRIGNSLADCTK